MPNFLLSRDWHVQKHATDAAPVYDAALRPSSDGARLRGEDAVQTSWPGSRRSFSFRGLSLLSDSVGKDRPFQIDLGLWRWWRRRRSASKWRRSRPSTATIAVLSSTTRRISTSASGLEPPTILRNRYPRPRPPKNSSFFLLGMRRNLFFSILSWSDEKPWICSFFV